MAKMIILSEDIGLPSVPLDISGYNRTVVDIPIAEHDGSSADFTGADAYVSSYFNNTGAQSAFISLREGQSISAMTDFVYIVSAGNYLNFNVVVDSTYTQSMSTVYTHPWTILHQPSSNAYGIIAWSSTEDRYRGLLFDQDSSSNLGYVTQLYNFTDAGYTGLAVKVNIDAPDYIKAGAFGIIGVTTEGYGSYDDTVNCELLGSSSENTVLERDEDNTFILTIGEDETDSFVIVKAYCVADPSVEAHKTINIVRNATVTGIDIITTGDTIATGCLKNVRAVVIGDNGVNAAAFTASVSGNNSADTKAIHDGTSCFFSLFCGWEETADSFTLTVTSVQDPTVSASKTFTVVQSDTGGDSGSTGGDGSGSGSEGGDSGDTGGDSGDSGDSGDDSGSTGTASAEALRAAYMAGLATGLALYSCK